MKYLFCLMMIGIVCQAKEIDLLKISFEKKGTNRANQLMLGDMLQPYREGFLWRTPAGPQSSHIKLEPVSVKSASRYVLTWEMLPAQALRILVFVTFYGEDGEAYYRFFRKCLMVPTGRFL